MLNNVTFIKKNGGIPGQPLTQDHISGMAIFGTVSGVTAGNTYQFFNAQEAEDEGFTGDYLERIEEYFRMNNQGNLYVGVFQESDDDDKVKELQNVAEGTIRQCLVIRDTEAFSDSLVSSLQAVADELEANYRPTQFVLEADFSAYTPSDIRGNGRKNVSVVLGNSVGKTWNAAATLLGVISISKVSHSVAWVERNNIQAGTMYADVEILGENLRDKTDSELYDLQNRGFITLRSFTDFAGVYFTDSTTTDLDTSDFRYIENNRVIDKALRQLRVTLLPDLSSPAYLEEDGTLSPGTIAYFESKCENVLRNLENNLEISAGQVIINPSQNILSTGELQIFVEIIPVATNRKIKVTMGFTTSF